MFKPAIGLEIHAELNTFSKMFCSCRNDSNPNLPPNTNICPVCLGHPGTLPVINKEAVKKVLKGGLALHCQINRKSFFERKNYFYPDLPKGYQISQFSTPFCQNGFLSLGRKKIRIRRIHLEEDTGKLIHPAGADYSLIDFNRAGVPLLELVTEPEITSSKEAALFSKELQLILRYLHISGADMEKGEMRVEVNISLAKSNKKLGTKVEIKNLNSIKAVEKSIEYEIKRQTEILKKGGTIIQETRGWDDVKEITFPQREKEGSPDYRYFPEPDLPPFEIEEEFLEKIKAELPELPSSRRERFRKEYGLIGKEQEIYVVQKELGDYFEEIISELTNWVKEKEFKKRLTKEEFKKIVKIASNYLATDLQGLLSEKSLSVRDKKFLITAENFAEFVSMIYRKEISSKIAKTLLKTMLETGKDPSQILEEEDLRPIVDKNELKALVQEIIRNNPKAVKDYHQGKKNAFQFLIGEVMRKTKGTASPAELISVLKKELDSFNKDSLAS